MTLLALWLDAQFIFGHWRPNGRGGWECDAFDPVTRLCTMHDERPPICRDYPYYDGGQDGTDLAARKLQCRCAFRADSPTLQLWGVTADV